MKNTVFKILIVYLLHIPVVTVEAMNVLVVESGEIVKTDSLPSTKFEIETLPQGYKITYTFDSLVVVKDEVFPETSYLTVPGFGLCETPGCAAVVTGMRRFLFDMCKHVTLTDIEIESVEYPWKYSPARTPRVNSCDSVIAIAPIDVEDIYKPMNSVQLGENLKYRGKYINEVYISPTQYNSFAQRIRINKKISFLLNIQEDIANLSDKIAEDDVILRNISSDLLGKESSKRFQITGLRDPIDDGVYDVTKHFLIISTTPMSSIVNRLAEWKRTMGYRVEVSLSDTWSEARIKNAILECYNTYPDLYYVILIGDDNSIPTCTSRTKHPHLNRYFLTDVPYACLDGEDDFYPDVYIGRIPASTCIEANNIVEKIILYEKDPSFNKNNTTAICSAYFQDTDDHNGVEDRGFVYTTDRIYHYIAEQFDHVGRIYCTNPNVNPKKWSSRYGDGGDLPSELLRHNFSWDGDKYDVINALENGCNLLYHRDHGSYTGWGGPSIHTRDFKGVSNTVLPVLLSIDCSVGNFTDANNLARALLSKGSAGVVSAIAAVEQSYTNRNDAFVTAMINGVWPMPGLDYMAGYYKFSTEQMAPVTSLGEMIAYGMIKIDECFSSIGHDGKYSLGIYDRTQKDLYHCLGDPSLSLFWNASCDVRGNATMTRDFDGLHIQGLPGRSIITFYNRTTGQSNRYSGFNVDISCCEKDDIYCYIVKPGYKPMQFHNFNQTADTNLSSNIIQSVTKEGNILIVKLSDNLDFSNYDINQITLNRLDGTEIGSQRIELGNTVYYFSSSALTAYSGYLIVSFRAKEEIIESKTVTF